MSDAQIERALGVLVERLSREDGLVVAYSGGVDSSVVATAARRALGNRMIAVLAVSPLLPEEEVLSARRVASEAGFPLLEVAHPGLEHPLVFSNTRDRCYACKSSLMPALREVAVARGFSAIAHGENADDRSAHRPGSRAAEEAGVLSPLADLGLSKADVRALARALGLSNAEKPSTPCLATRFPYDTPIDPDSLRRVENAETALREQFGLTVFRVRSEGDRARLEVDVPEIDEALRRSEDIVASLLESGFSEAEVDPAGYRSGSFDSRS